MIARLLTAAFVLVFPALAAAHGENHENHAAHAQHGTAEPLAGAGPVRIHGYWLELLTRPARPVISEPIHLVVTLAADPSRIPVSGAQVLIGLDPAGSHAQHAGHVHRTDLAPASEVSGAGQYELVVSPERKGPYQVHVALMEAEGRKFSPPVVIDFPIAIGTAPGMGGAVWGTLGLVVLIAALALYWLRLRARIGLPASERLNLLDVSWLRRLLTAPAFALSMQVVLLGLMAVVVFLGFFDAQDGGVNIASRLTWTIWWAGIIFTFVLLGRVWCVACPFGALNEWTSRLAAPIRRLPRPLRNIWWATGLFVLLTWADEQLGVVRSPRVTAWIVIIFVALAVAVGFLFERRSFCRYLCPIGGVIGLYSMAAPLELRVKDSATCRHHPEQQCYRGGETSRGCPMFEFPQSMDRNNYCTLCVECVKGCARDNLVLRFRAFGRDLWASSRRAMDESYLAVMLVGLTFLVTAQMLGAWSHWTSALASWLPALVGGGIEPGASLRVVESAVLLVGSLVVVPLLVLAAVFLADRSAGPARVGLRKSFVLFGYMFVPIGLAMHLAHNLAHLLLEGGGIVPAVQRAIELYTPWSLGQPEWPASPLAPAAVVSVFQTVVLVGFFVLSLVAGYRLALRAYLDPRIASTAVVPMAVLSLVFTVIGIVLLNQPMGMRHGP
jgi:4Fe-4S binding protein